MRVQDARTKSLLTISTMERTPVDELIAAPLQSEWVWLLNAGNMEARARTGIARIENLPGSPVHVVELLGKPYALIHYASPAKAVAAMEVGAQGALLEFAVPAAVERVLEGLKPSHPAPSISTTEPKIHTFPNGLQIIYDFLTPEEEVEMIREYHSTVQACDGGTLKRGALHFGPHFDYTTFATSTSAHTPPPTYLTQLLDRLPAQDIRDIPDQFTIQYYPPGTGIPPHVDTHSAFEESLYSLSFGADVPMQFRQCGAKEARRMRLPKRSLGDKESSTPPPSPSSQRDASPLPFQEKADADAEEWELVLPPRSLLIMKGASRYGYTHGIKGRRFDQEGTSIVPRRDRYSVTMRRVKPADEVRCDCAFPHVCDWRIRLEREGSAA
ncbi:hypothetical protein AAFC00_001406 [Neodothiora populina]|uniref:Fe2OG dioxygenase domain-containing protein n=1 Tax=Neodothiora populina TaxID=2781224 RepID=A0ABR3PPW3_9PEZI